jgi:hypothetical protein
MIVGGIIQATMGVDAAGRDLEDVAPPLSATGDALEEPGEQADPYTVAAEEGRGVPAGGSPRFERDGARGTPEPAAERDPVTRTHPNGGQ